MNNWIATFGAEAQGFIATPTAPGSDLFRYTFLRALGDRYSAADLSPEEWKLEYTPKIKLQLQRDKSGGGCGGPTRAMIRSIQRQTRRLTQAGAFSFGVSFLSRSVDRQIPFQFPFTHVQAVLIPFLRLGFNVIVEQGLAQRGAHQFTLLEFRDGLA